MEDNARQSGGNAAEEFWGQSRQWLEESGYRFDTRPPQIRIGNAKVLMQSALKYVVGADARWIPEYEEIAGWLTDNGRKGLLVKGNCGTGKTLLCGRVIPLILMKASQKIVVTCPAVDLNKRIDDLLRARLVYIDDVGTESQSVVFGNRRECFAELVDRAERDGKLLMITTNLSTKDFKARYGERVMDRLRGITKAVNFAKNSMRG